MILIWGIHISLFGEVPRWLIKNFKTVDDDSNVLKWPEATWQVFLYHLSGWEHSFSYKHSVCLYRNWIHVFTILDTKPTLILYLYARSVVGKFWRSFMKVNSNSFFKLNFLSVFTCFLCFLSVGHPSRSFLVPHFQDYQTNDQTVSLLGLYRIWTFSHCWTIKELVSSSCLCFFVFCFFGWIFINNIVNSESQLIFTRKCCLCFFWWWIWFHFFSWIGFLEHWLGCKVAVPFLRFTNRHLQKCFLAHYNNILLEICTACNAYISFSLMQIKKNITHYIP